MTKATNINRAMRGTKKRLTTSLEDALGKEEFFQTSIPVLNLMCSGSLLGGIDRGVTTIAGNSASYKTILTLHIIKDFIDYHEDNGLEYSVEFFDTEGGANKPTWDSLGIDVSKVNYTRVYHLEMLTTQLLELASLVKEKGKEDVPMLVVVDSLGQIDSKVTADKMVKEGHNEDMGRRAKALNQFIRVISGEYGPLNTYMIMINQIYEAMDQYTPPKMRGGQGIKFTSQTVLMTNEVRAEDRNNFKVRVRLEKSRRVRKNAHVDIEVNFVDGLVYSSYITEMANNIGYIKHTSSGRYRILDHIDTETGEMVYDESRTITIKSITDDEIVEEFLMNPLFHDMVESEYAFKMELNEENLSRRKGLRNNLRDITELRNKGKLKKEAPVKKVAKKKEEEVNEEEVEG